MVTLTGTFTRLDGTPATGTVRVTPSRSPIMDPDGKIVISGPQVFPLDKDGKLTTEIPASDDPDLGPPFTYAIDVNLTHASWKISKVWIPYGSTTVDLSEIGDYQPVPGVATRVVTIPADGTDGQVLVWDGAGFSWDFPPKGDKGDKGDPGMSDIVVDTTVGKRVWANGQLVYANSGWRDLRPTLINGWTASLQVKIRRVNELVTLSIAAGGGALNGSAATSDIFVALPSGFRPDTGGNYGAFGFVMENDTNIVRIRKEVGNVAIASRARIDGVVTFPGVGEFPDPTTYPGTPL